MHLRIVDTVVVKDVCYYVIDLNGKQVWRRYSDLRRFNKALNPYYARFPPRLWIHTFRGLQDRRIRLEEFLLFVSIHIEPYIIQLYLPFEL